MLLSSFLRFCEKIPGTEPGSRRSIEKGLECANSRTAGRRKADSVPRKRKRSDREEENARSKQIQGEPLEPVRVVERELTRPDGTTMTVEVPVYPPFQLKKRTPAKQSRPEKVRKAS